MLRSIFTDLLHLFYPHVCNGCGSDLLTEDNLLCAKCISQLPHTCYAQHAGNPIEKRLQSVNKSLSENPDLEFEIFHNDS